MVDAYFPRNAIGLGRMVYGKRAASSLYALGETLRRRQQRMGTPIHPDEMERIGEEDNDERELIGIAHLDSRSSREEQRGIAELLVQIDLELGKDQVPGSKWPRLENEVLLPNRGDFRWRRTACCFHRVRGHRRVADQEVPRCRLPD